MNMIVIEGHSGLNRPAALKRAGVFLLTALIVLSLAQPARSQAAAQLSVYGLQTNTFPAMQFNLEAYDSQGSFVEDLQPADIRLMEDGQPVTDVDVTLTEPGLQFSLAITPGAQMDTRFGDHTQLDLLRSAVQAWAARQSTGADNDYSFSTQTGLQVIRSAEPQQLSDALDLYRPDLARSEVNLFSLTTALDLVADQAVDARVKRAILLITPPLAPTMNANLQEAVNRAQQAGVRVFVWVAVTSLDAAAPDTSALQNLTDSTGGRLTLVAGNETIPDLESWLAPLRKAYQVRFISRVTQSGPHRLSIGLLRSGFEELLHSLEYVLEIKPPNPIFLSPPTRLERFWSDPPQGEDASLLPAQQPIKILVEFPDSYTRPLTAARLYLDGALLVENTSAPFEEFAWDLTQFTESGTHVLRVEVVDMLGLTGSSIDVPVEVIVAVAPPAGLLEQISSRGLVAVAAVLVAGAVLALVLVGENRLRGRRKRGDKRRMDDPVTQPVTIAQEKPRRKATSESSSWPKTAAAPGTPARMIRISEDGQAVPGSLIALNRSEITFGSDARQAIIHVEDPSVSKLHARIVRNGESGFTLLDAGSIAGTWVNFNCVTTDGARLEHDDLIHMGRVTFRYELTKPPAARQPVIENMEETA